MLTKGETVSIGDLVEYSSARGSIIRGLVVGVAHCQEDLLETDYKCVKFDPWPEVDPLFILVDNEVSFWCGSPTEITVASRADATLG